MVVDGGNDMWKRMDVVTLFTENIEKSVLFYQSLGLSKDWETTQDEKKQWKLVGMKYPEGNTELVLMDNPDLKFVKTEIVVDDVWETYYTLISNPEVRWLKEPFPHPLGGHVGIMQAPDGNIFMLVGK